MEYNGLAIGMNLRNLRKKNKITIEELSDRLGVSCSHICQLELGSRRMSIELMLRYMEVFDTDANTILAVCRKDTTEDTVDNAMKELTDNDRQYLDGVFRFIISNVAAKV